MATLLSPGVPVHIVEEAYLPVETKSVSAFYGNWIDSIAKQMVKEIDEQIVNDLLAYAVKEESVLWYAPAGVMRLTYPFLYYNERVVEEEKVVQKGSIAQALARSRLV